MGIGTLTPSSALEVVGIASGLVGGFAAGEMQVRGAGTSLNSNAVLTGHNSFNVNTQLWYLGSVSSSNLNIALINRQNGELHLHANDTKYVTAYKKNEIQSPQF